MEENREELEFGKELEEELEEISGGWQMTKPPIMWYYCKVCGRRYPESSAKFNKFRCVNLIDAKDGGKKICGGEIKKVPKG